MTKPDYGKLGSIGVATPQANPTVEPEFQALAPAGVGLYVTRLTSRAKSSRRRLTGYLRQIKRAVESFDTMPLDAFAFACTGQSYLLGRQKEADLIASAGAAYPILTASMAVETAFKKMKVRKIALVTPYPDWLTDAAVRFWHDGGFKVVAINQISLSSDDTRNIYQLSAQVVQRHLKNLDVAEADAVLITGTGLPSLELIPKLKKRTGLPVLSSNACLAAACFDLVGK